MSTPDRSPQGSDDDEDLFGTPMQPLGVAQALELPNPVNLDVNFSETPVAPVVATDPCDIAAATEAAAVTAAVNEAVSVRKAKRKSPMGTTTARNKKKSKEETKIKIGCRIQSQRKILYLCGRLSQQQQDFMKEYPNNYRFYGTVMSGKGATGYTVDYDLFPAEHKRVIGLMRQRLTVMKLGAEEPSMPNSAQLIAEELEDQRRKEAKMDPYTKSIVDFLRLKDEEVATADLFEMKLKDTPAIEWQIIADGVNITDQPLDHPEELHLKKDIDFGKDSLDTILFREFMPDVKGHAALMDEFFADKRAPYHSLVQEEKIKFHQQEDEEDYDWIVKQCYLLLIAAITEPETGIDNLWKKGKTRGRHSHADFGKYVPINVFKCFIAAAPFMFCDKKWWYAHKRDRDWEVFTPVLESFNKKRRALFLCQLLMMDESMSAWKPKTSKLGGMPNIVNEPRKPVDLGAQLRNAVECLTGVLMYQEPTMGPERQRMKDFFYKHKDSLTVETTSLPRKEPMSAHTAEVLRLAHGSALKEDGWCGGDAWFGSVMSCIELRTRLNVHSTFIIKGHTQYFPIHVLERILKVRHGSRAAGHWVTMRAVISGVPLTAIAYAWSQRGVSYFITTTGNTTPSPHFYESKFEDEWGNVESRELPRPEIIHFFYEYAPLIDEHNKARQSLLALEKRWQTRNPWFRLICTVLGMSIVDMFRLYRYYEIKIHGREQTDVDEFRLIQFTDYICGGMREWQYKRQRRNPQRRVNLVRIRNEDTGDTNLEPTAWQVQKKNLKVGNPITLQCYVCRKYLKENGSTTYRATSWWCKECHMPLCELDRTGKDGGREMSCQDEHCCTEEVAFGCNHMHPKAMAVPKELQISLWPRRSNRARV